jgi:hypothetical protein
MRPGRQGHLPAIISARWAARCALVALALLAGMASPAVAETATPPGSIGLRLMDAPASGAGDPRAQIYIVDHLAPGQVIQRRVEVSNTTAATTAVALYAGAATVADGAFVAGADRTANDLSTWTSIDPATIQVPAGGTAVATVTVAVPADAAPGEQYAVVWAEARATPDGAGVTEVSRVGIRLYISVGPGGAPAADFTVDSLTAVRDASGAPVIRATVHNTGGRALDLSGTVSLSGGPGGLSAGPFAAEVVTTLGVTQTGDVTTALDPALPSGPWTVQVTLRSGLLERTTEGTVTFPAPGATAPVAVPAPAFPWASWAPWILLALVAAALIVRAIRRRRRSVAPPPDVPSSL